MLRHVLLAIGLGLALTGCGQPQQQQMPPPVVGFITVTEQPVALTVELPGRTSPFAVSEIRPQINGIVQKRLFVEGSTVKAGQALYQIDPSLYQATYDNALATLADAKAKADRYASLLSTERDRAPGRRRRQGRLPPGQGQCRYRPHQSGLHPHHRAHHRTHRPLHRDRGRAGHRQQATALDTVSDARSDLCRCGSVERRAAGAQARHPGRQCQFRRPAHRGSVAEAGRRQRLSADGQAAIHRCDGGSRHRRGAAARHLPQSRQFLLPGMYVRATINRGRGPARHPGAAKRGRPRPEGPAHRAGGG